MTTFSPFGLLPGMTLILDPDQERLVTRRAYQFLGCLNEYERGVAIRGMEHNIEEQIMAQAGEFISLLSMQLPREAWGPIQPINGPRLSWDIRDHLAASCGLIDVKTTKIPYEYLFLPVNKPNQLENSEAEAFFLAKASRRKDKRIEGLLYGWVSKERFQKEHKVNDGSDPQASWKLDPNTKYMHQTTLDTDFELWRLMRGKKRKPMV